jgi:hypothetical protein
VLVFHPPVMVLVSGKKFVIVSSKGKKQNKQTTTPPNQSTSKQINLKFKCNTVSVSPSASSPSLSLSHQKTKRTKKRKKRKKSLETALWMSIWGCGSPATYCHCRLYLGRSQEWVLHSSSPAGFVCLAFYWLHALLFSPVCSPTCLLQLQSVFII